MKDLNGSFQRGSSHTEYLLSKNKFGSNYKEIVSNFEVE